MQGAEPFLMKQLGRCLIDLICEAVSDAGMVPGSPNLYPSFGIRAIILGAQNNGPHTLSFGYVDPVGYFELSVGVGPGSCLTGPRAARCPSVQARRYRRPAAWIVAGTVQFT